MEEQATCGRGLAAHAEIPAKIGELIASLADNLDTHVPTVDVGEAAGRAERAAYERLATRFREIAALIARASSEMAGYRDLPAAHHHEAALADLRIVECFTRFVELEGELAALLGGAHARDAQMLHGMRAGS